MPESFLSQSELPDQLSHADSLDRCLEQQLRDLDGHATLSRNLHAVLGSSRPHLLRYARLRGIPSDAAEDVVQETLLEAWRSLMHLRDPEHLGAWLDGICRNVCLRHLRAHYRGQDEIPLSAVYEEGGAEDIPDPQAFDPADLLDRYDLEHLLDLALAHLSDEARQVVTLFYLADLPQQEIAQRLRLNLRALEKRLQRARQQLRQIFSS
ncbi:MAG TPA: sigma-70 family RNA polymerase sigma factor, partial [Ktedonobacterales bacterium]|nr:sigma-70 family RNA polymerase sigma factor [Ktedonobacterales bacterium]